VLAEGERAGLFTCPDPGLTARALMGVMNWTLTWYKPGGAETIDKIADRYADLFFNGLLK
jgi:hypothetical protein